MQSSVRAENNAALDFAIQEANSRGLPVLAVFGITDNFPGANERSFAFLFEGLLDAAVTLRRRGVRLVVIRRPPLEAVMIFAPRAATVIVDAGYLRVLRTWRKQVGAGVAALGKQLIEVEDNTLVPTALIRSPPGGEKAAATLRPKLVAQMDRFAVVYPPLELANVSFASDASELNVAWLELLYPSPVAPDTSSSAASSSGSGAGSVPTAAATGPAGSLDYIQNCLLTATSDISSGAALPDYYAVAPNASAVLQREQHYYRLLGRAGSDARLRLSLFEKMLAGMTNLDRSVPRIQGALGRHGGQTEARKRLLEWVGGHKALYHATSAVAGLSGAHVVAGNVSSSSSSSSATAGLETLVSPQLAGYGWNRKKPELDGRTSQLSAYLHYGHISPAEVAVAVLKGYEEAIGLVLHQGQQQHQPAVGPEGSASLAPSSSSSAHSAAEADNREDHDEGQASAGDDDNHHEAAMPDGMDFGGVRDDDDDDEEEGGESDHHEEDEAKSWGKR
jgi:DNA photolyase